ncbi:MAG TPA: RecQ family ATP-dependent DNA helicase [Smithellaceae bacterium]|jgi:ATP-dependent DNA helicase RecQ|nr:RecQ family ATP-dependent DNA helicase [Smithellaceae bacterium]HPL98159.1 RecQ family ATP-dependent DNA helicase [Smithellaceae bacterium]
MDMLWSKDKALNLLRMALNNHHALFRNGQWETIDQLVNQNQKMLLVQRTGWGKSVVYFISARILRDQKRGPTIIISPLLALMRNQIVAAERIGIRAVTINSTNLDDWEKIKKQILEDQIDTLLISPERLANDDFIENILLPIGQRIGLLVVDEAHCISDWGHDFRPDYRRIVNILRQIPSNTPILGTTATANNRVVQDVCEQLGDIKTLRGELARESLSLQNIRLHDKAARMAWLAEQVPRMSGTGIIYTLTKRDAEQVSGWLWENGISSAAYYSDVKNPDFESSDLYRRHLEDRLLNNDLKVLVSTTALGMGYDKPDLGFVIHYQAPGSVIAYYQQVGRAGRAIQHARGILLSGREDEEIHEYFRNSAFPSEAFVREILSALEESDGLTIHQLQGKVNLRMMQIEQVLKFLRVENPSPVLFDNFRWYRTAVDYEMDHDRIAFLTQRRIVEWQQIKEYIDHAGCLMKFLRQALDDPDALECAKCKNCDPNAALQSSFSRDLALKALDYIKRSELILSPKKLVPKDTFPVYGFNGNLEKHNLSLEFGRILSRWEDAGWGRLVAEGKHAGHFDSELVNAVCAMIRERWKPDPFPQWVTCVPSLNHLDLVPNFAKDVANKLGLPFHGVVVKTRRNEPQKIQNNRYHQCRNLDGVFSVSDKISSAPALLIDDIVDSGWTMTVIGALLRKAGCSNVYPMALATTAGGG